MGGKAVIAGTRMPVWLLLREAANGMSAEEIATAYPVLTVEDVRAAFAWAADAVRDGTGATPDVDSAAFAAEAARQSRLCAEHDDGTLAWLDDVQADWGPYEDAPATS